MASTHKLNLHLVEIICLAVSLSSSVYSFVFFSLYLLDEALQTASCTVYHIRVEKLYNSSNSRENYRITVNECHTHCPPLPMGSDTCITHPCSVTECQWFVSFLPWSLNWVGVCWTSHPAVGLTWACVIDEWKLDLLIVSTAVYRVPTQGDK